MKIYTYYEDIKHNSEYQQSMLKLWQISWQNSGFEPIILSPQDATKHSFYEEFIERLKNLHIQIMGRPITAYGLSCYIRWLAYSTQYDKYFYVSDYDCCNNGLEPFIHTEKLYFMDADCPCFVSGKPNQFENLCNLFVNLNAETIQDIKCKIKTEGSRHRWFHDQDFCTLNLIKNKETMEANNIIMKRDRKNGVGPFYLDKENTVKVLHISHHNAGDIKKTTKDFEHTSLEETRLQIMKQIIENNI